MSAEAPKSIQKLNLPQYHRVDATSAKLYKNIMENLVLAAIHDIEHNMSLMNVKCGGTHTIPVVPDAPTEKPKKALSPAAAEKAAAKKPTATCQVGVDVDAEYGSGLGR